MRNEKIWIGNDHGGYELKLQLIEAFKQKGIDLVDIGSDSVDIVRYPHFAEKIALAIGSKKADKGILICSTGIGMCIIANKYRGIRAALCTSTYMAKMTRKHNDSNVLCLGGKITGEFEAIDIVETWIETEFEGGRHCISLDLIEDMECSILNEGQKKD